MDEEFDPVIHPHPPLPLPHMRYENHFEVDPIRIDPIINTVVRLDPITVHIARIGFLRAETPVDEYVVNAGQPKCFDGGPQAFQEPAPPRSEPEPASYFFQCCPVITRRQRTSARVESRNHTTSMMSGTRRNVNSNAVIVSSPRLSEPSILRSSQTVSRGRCHVSLCLLRGVTSSRTRRGFFRYGVCRRTRHSDQIESVMDIGCGRQITHGRF